MTITRFLFPALTVALCSAAVPHATKFSSALADNPGPPTAAQLASIKFADVNGDGLPDLCFLDTPGIMCALFVKNTASGSSFGMPLLWLANGDLLDQLTDPKYYETIQYGDINGDGIADLCLRQHSGYFCFPSDGTRFQQVLMKAGQFGDANGWGNNPMYWRSIKLVDLNHDGMMDVCGRSPGGIVCQLAQPRNIFGAWNIWSADFSDANANGWNSGPAYWSTIQFADLNGDGLPDVCGRGISGIFCAINNGSRFMNTELSTTQFSDMFFWNQEPYYSTILLGDINGDGKADVCGRGTHGMYCGVTQVAGTFAGAFDLSQPDYSDATGWNNPAEYKKIWLIDVNGDGKADICGRGSQGIHCALSTSTAAGPSFMTAQLLISSFGDVDGFRFSESYWGTVQPVHSSSQITLPGQRMVGFCGRGFLGIYCSVNFF